MYLQQGWTQAMYTRHTKKQFGPILEIRFGEDFSVSPSLHM